MAFPFLQRTNLAELARQCRLAQYQPVMTLEQLTPGVDNVRHDVFLSAHFREVAGAHIARMIARYGTVEDLAAPDSGSATFRPPSIFVPAKQPKVPVAKGPDPADFKTLISELLIAALTRAKAEANVNVDLLAQLAVLKLLRAELASQFAAVLERCRAKSQALEGPRQGNQARAMEVRERVARLQVNKKHILRKAGQELFQTLREVDKEKLARMRRSLLGDEASTSYELFLNRLLFTEDGRDDYLNAEHYVMIGNYDRDPDRSARILDIASQFLESLDALALAPEYATYDVILSAPENAQELVGGGTPDESTTKGKAQKAILAAWLEALEREGMMEHVIASYEVVPLLSQYWPHVHAQQLKEALLTRDHYHRVIGLLEEHGKLSPDALNQAQKRVSGYRGAERAKVAGRFLLDFMRYRRDLRRMEAVNAACEKVNVVASDRLRELSSINNTLYEFLLPEEQKRSEEKVSGHAILKADIRDSTRLTRTLMERGLNPASFFSLNFYEPVNTLLAKYEATKVFIEGDAVILALFEREGEPGFCVARTCVLAREMIQIVHAYNEKSQASGLPPMELGIGIAFQDSAPLYLMDGGAQIMISSAINLSDRLSSCSKASRRFVRPGLPFNVFGFQTVEESETGGSLDEFLVRYNVGGITLDADAFEKLRTEISLDTRDVDMPMLWGAETVRLYSGLVPVGSGSFHPLVVREVPVAHIDAVSFALKRWTTMRYYEVVTNAAIHDLLQVHARSAAAGTRQPSAQ